MKNKIGLLKKADLILIGGAFIVALFMFLIYIAYFDEAGENAVVYYDGVEIGRYPLSEDGEYLLNETNTIRIKDGVVDMIHADCKNQLCVMQRPIQNLGESIVCLPGKIVVQIEGTNANAMPNGIDTIVY